MFKRPLIPVALAVLLFSVLIVFIIPEIVYPELPTEEGSSCSISGKIYKIEEKTYSYYIYIISGRRHCLLTVKKDNFIPDEYKYGNTVCASCSYTGFSAARNLGNYDEETYYKSIGIGWKYEAQSISITGREVDIISQAAHVMANAIAASIGSAIPESSREAGTLTAMATGNKSSLDSDVSDLYRASGIAHILAISGLHISFAGMGIYRILRKRLRFTVAAPIASAVVLLYCLMSGASASSVRALIMVLTRLGATGLGRKSDTISSLCLSGILLLIDNPFYITNSGFLLSFLAICGIFIVGETAESYILKNAGKSYTPSDEPGTLKKIASAAKAAAGKSFISGTCVTLVTLPVILESYYEFPLYGVLLNIIILPLTSYILGGTLAGSIAGMVWRLPGRIILGAEVYLLKFVDILCAATAGLPGARVVTGHLGTWQILAYYFVLTAAVVFMKLPDDIRDSLGAGAKNVMRRMARRFTGRENSHTQSGKERKYLQTGRSICRKIGQRFDRHKRKIAAMAVGIALLVLTLPKAGGGCLRIAFIDVGQGECILIMAPDRTTFMIDSGSTSVSNVYDYRVESAVKYFGVSSIDYLIITHPDTDHISAVIDILEANVSGNGISVRRILVPDFSGNEKYENILSLAREADIAVTELKKGVSVAEGQLSLTCIYPYITQTDDVNEMSAVISMEYGSFAALFTGDIDSEVEEKLLERIGDGEDCLLGGYTLLDVAHHGSKYSSSVAFVDAISPEVAAISAGVDNIYGHPADETLERLKKTGADIYNTADCGEIIINARENGEYTVQTALDSPDG